MSFSVGCWLLMLYEKAKDFFLEVFKSLASFNIIQGTKGVACPNHQNRQ